VFNYLPQYPTIPDDLVEQLLQAPKERSNTFAYPSYQQYKIFTVHDLLKDYLTQYIPFPVHPSVHIIEDGLAIHKDVGRTTAINYILDPGGDSVRTSFYRTREPESVFYEVDIEPGKWHSLDVSHFHTVNGIAEGRKRVAITLTPLDSTTTAYDPYS
jgi:hypothetical protein